MQDSHSHTSERVPTWVLSVAFVCPSTVDSRVEAGFPSPADDYVERTLDLNEELITRPAATFFLRAGGRSMQGAGIHDGRRRKSLLAEAPARHPPCDTAPHPLEDVEAEGEVRRCLAAAYVRETV